jgi:recombination protein RecT
MAAGNQLAKRAHQNIEAMSAFLQKNDQRIQAAMPTGVKAALITRTFMAEVRRNYKLAACKPETLRECFEQMVLTGLDVGHPITAKAYLIPYGDEAQFQVGYKGVKEMIRRSGQGTLIMEEVREGDEFQDRGSAQLPHHVRSLKPDRHRQKLTHVFAAYVPHVGLPVVSVWSVERCMDHRDRYSKGFKGKKDDAWHPDNPAFPVMCMKCPVMYLAGRGDLPLSSDVAAIVAREEGQPVEAVRFEPTPAPAIAPPSPEPEPTQEPAPMAMIESAAKECETAEQCDGVRDDLIAKYPDQKDDIAEVFTVRKDHIQIQAAEAAG